MSVCVCVYIMQRGITLGCTVCTMSNSLQKEKKTNVAHVQNTYLYPTVCIFAVASRHCNADILEKFYVILTVCVFHLRRTSQTNYRVILHSQWTKSHEWNPVARQEALLLGPKASIMELQ